MLPPPFSAWSEATPYPSHQPDKPINDQPSNWDWHERDERGGQPLVHVGDGKRLLEHPAASLIGS
jgi:hypothetical protein